MYIPSSISSSETDVKLYRLHFMAWVKPIAIGLGGVMFLLYSLIFGPPAAIKGMFLGYSSFFGFEENSVWKFFGLLVFCLASFRSMQHAIQLYFIEQALTSRRIIFKFGIFTLYTNEILLSNVETVSVYQSFLGRIFGYGSISVTGTGSHPVHLIYVSNPVQVKITVEDAASHYF